MDSIITNAGDYLIARANVEIDLAKKILESARDERDYFREKAAAKLLAYQEKEAELLIYYVEIRTNYPDLITALEEHKPYLKAMWREAEAEWQALRHID